MAIIKSNPIIHWTKQSVLWSSNIPKADDEFVLLANKIF